ncbi:hypothetical protein ACFV29_15735 [Streptomyces sp. NPDC059690]|uniref:hypothetical protein n=1 Tax=Streptomyces sp. NPDC059690 TaxID=3346907 RepID=UPI003675F2D1
MIHIKRGLLTAAAAFVALAALTAPAAHATDDVPCGSPVERDLADPLSGRVRPGTTVRHCNLTRGHVPVFATRSPGAPVVGHPEQGGAAPGSSPMRGARPSRTAPPRTTGGAAAWGTTAAGAGSPRSASRAARTTEDDAGLLMPGAYTCANACAPLPFGAR